MRFYFLSALCTKIADHFRRSSTEKSDHDILLYLAAHKECSEYDIFMESAEIWNFSVDKVDRDFKEYLLKNEIPPYVKDYLKKSDKE